MATLPLSWIGDDNCSSWFVNHSLVFYKMTVTEQPRIINGMEHQVLTVGGLDRCQINTRLLLLNVEIDKLRVKQSALIEARNQMNRHIELSEMGDLFDEMFGG